MPASKEQGKADSIESGNKRKRTKINQTKRRKNIVVSYPNPDNSMFKIDGRSMFCMATLLHDKPKLFSTVKKE